MTDQELLAARELVYIAREVASVLATHPDTAAYLLVGDADDADSELSRLVRAIEALGPQVFAAWGHRHADEVVS